MSSWVMPEDGGRKHGAWQRLRHSTRGLAEVSHPAGPGHSQTRYQECTHPLWACLSLCNTARELHDSQAGVPFLQPLAFLLGDSSRILLGIPTATGTLELTKAWVLSSSLPVPKGKCPSMMAPNHQSDPFFLPGPTHHIF